MGSLVAGTLSASSPEMLFPMCLAEHAIAVLVASIGEKNTVAYTRALELFLLGRSSYFFFFFRLKIRLLGLAFDMRPSPYPREGIPEAVARGSIIILLPVVSWYLRQRIFLVASLQVYPILSAGPDESEVSR